MQNGSQLPYYTVSGSVSLPKGIYIPAENNGVSVLEIEEGGFSGKVMTSVDIPAGVVTIGDSAFNRCYYLSKVYIPYSVTSIGSKAFANCILTKIYFSGTLEQWNAIEKASDWDKGVITVPEIICIGE